MSKRWIVKPLIINAFSRFGRFLLTDLPPEKNSNFRVRIWAMTIFQEVGQLPIPFVTVSPIM